MAFPFRGQVASALKWMGAAMDVPAPPKSSLSTAPGGATGLTTGFEGSSLSRRLSPWIPNRNHLNSMLATEGPLLRARTRQLIANNPFGSNASATFTSYVAGSGIVPSPDIGSVSAKTKLKQVWTDWTDDADADGLTDFYGLQSIVAKAVFDAGEVFVRRRDQPASSGFAVPMQLQLIESEQLDSSMTMTWENGNFIRSGIEFGPDGKRAAYHFWAVHPGDGTVQYNLGQKIRVPADEVLHIFKAERPGQLRGRPMLTPAMIKMYDLDRYEDAELTRKQGAAMFMAFITQEQGQDIGETGLVNDDTVADATGTAEVDLEPGMAHLLPTGHGIVFNEPADVGPNYEPFIYRNVLELCCGMGLPYFAVSGDTSKANYSSLRSSLLEARRRIEQFQWECMIFQLCRPVWIWWLTAASLSGAVRIPGFAANPRQFYRIKWITPKWDWVDPLKDMQAEKLAVDAGFKPRSDVIESMGEDPSEVDDRIAADRERERKLGLAFAVGFTKAPDAPAGSDQSAPVGSDQGPDAGGGQNNAQQNAA